jgi:hypothetical protein
MTGARWSTSGGSLSLGRQLKAASRHSSIGASRSRRAAVAPPAREAKRVVEIVRRLPAARPRSSEDCRGGVGEDIRRSIASAGGHRKSAPRKNLGVGTGTAAVRGACSSSNHLPRVAAGTARSGELRVRRRHPESCNCWRRHRDAWDERPTCLPAPIDRPPIH